ncbi:MAG: MoaD/ThiS family protein [Proteobacteria bacterium]|nr:MoaD/ThiS family protein [Pseudomonadota bacterium]
MMFLSLFKKKNKISINIKLLAGLDKIAGYNPETGITLETVEGARLKNVLKQIELPQDQPVSFLINGNKVSARERLQDGDEVFCFLPFAGG